MNKSVLKQAPAVLVLALGVSGMAHGACWIGPETNATSVQNDSGQGNYDCSVLSSPDGGQLVDLRSVLDENGSPVASVYFDGSLDENDFPRGTVGWSVKTDGDDRALYDVFVVSTNNKGKGSRCNYLYSNGPLAEDGPVGGEGLGAKDTGEVVLDYVSVCGDAEPLDLPPPQPPEPDFITTLGDNCETTVTDSAGDPLLTPEVAVGFTAGKANSAGGISPPKIAVCASGESVLDQIECAPNPPARTYVSANCQGPGPLSLEYCAPVEWDRGDLKYCWYYENQACDFETPPVSGEPEYEYYTRYCVGRTAGTFIPKPKIDSLEASIDVTQGSTTYTICIYGRCYYQ